VSRPTLIARSSAALLPATWATARPARLRDTSRAGSAGSAAITELANTAGSAAITELANPQDPPPSRRRLFHV